MSTAITTPATVAVVTTVTNADLHNNPIVIVNSGSQRASYAVAFQDHLQEDHTVKASVSKRSMETLKQMIDLGLEFSTKEKMESKVIERLRGFPGGDEVYTFLEMNGIDIFNFVEVSTTILNGIGSKGTGVRAKRGEGHKTKGNKFLSAVMSKLVCRLAPASTTGAITDEMLESGFEAALEALKEVDKTEILAGARKIAEKTGLDIDGHIRLRSAKDDSGEEEAEA